MRVVEKFEKSARKREKLVKRLRLIKPLYRNRKRLGKAVYSVLYLMAEHIQKKERI